MGVNVMEHIPEVEKLISEAASSGRISGDAEGWDKDYLARVERTPELSDERERYLIELVQTGGMAEEVVARKLLLESNQRTAIRAAERYRDEGVDLGLLLAEANTGVVRALDSYDPEADYSFGDWATREASLAIEAMLRDRSATVQLTPDEAGAVNHMLRVRQLLTEDRVKEPTVDEIAGRMGVDPERVGELMRLA
jgi:RNA polymerase primary sigma factor